ncbi:MAG: hypothetical protein KGZ87_00510 [Bacteroidetes bacterium]|nr:hypothetical protein [Bacteroidota bacterium]
MVFDYIYLSKILLFFESELDNCLVKLEFNKVLDFVQIDEIDFEFKPFKIVIFSKDLYKFFFMDDDKGINKEWILLEVNMKILNKNINVNINKIREKIIIVTENKSIQNKLKKLNIPFNE